ncbi:MAG: PCRF domain-containing protein, partial [Anaeroplasmataceae bacterium]
MFDRLEVMQKRYEQLNDLLTLPEIVCDIKKLTEYSKESRNLEKAVNKYNEYIKYKDSIPDLEVMASD